MKLEVKRVGDETALILPEEFLGRFNLAQGDWVHATENADGSLCLSPRDPAFENGLRVAERAMETYRNALSELAK